MNVISIKSIVFEKKYGERNNEKVKFKIAGLNDADLNFYFQGCTTDVCDGRGTIIHRFYHDWREVFSEGVHIIINCSIELDDKTVVEGNFDLDELFKGNVVKVEE